MQKAITDVLNRLKQFNKQLSDLLKTIESALASVRPVKKHPAINNPK